MNAELQSYYKRIDHYQEDETTSNRVIRFFSEVNMRNGHKGLAELAKEEGIDINKLKQGEFIMFMNTKQNALKMFAQGNVIAHLKMPGTQRINAKVITLLPRFFNGSKIEYNRALKEVIEREFK